MSKTPDAPERGKDFIRTIIDKDNESGKYEKRVHTRFPRNPMAICTSVMPSPSA